MVCEATNVGARPRTGSHRGGRCVRSREVTPEGDLHVVCRYVPHAPLTTGFIVCFANLMSEQLRPSRALDRGQVRVIVAHARRRGGVARVLCTHTASQHRVAAWRHISSHLLALTTATSGLTCPSVCALPRPSRSCHAAELPIVQPDIRHSTDVRSAPGAQVDPLSLGITEGIPFVLFGFRNVLVRARRMCLAALGPTVHHHRRSRSQV